LKPASSIAGDYIKVKASGRLTLRTYESSTTSGIMKTGSLSAEQVSIGAGDFLTGKQNVLAL
jgi:hypothetical protein